MTLSTFINIINVGKQIYAADDLSRCHFHRRFCRSFKVIQCRSLDYDRIRVKVKQELMSAAFIIGTLDGPVSGGYRGGSGGSLEPPSPPRF